MLDGAHPVESAPSAAFSDASGDAEGAREGGDGPHLGGCPDICFTESGAAGTHYTDLG